MARWAGAAALISVVLLAAAAPFLATHDPAAQFSNFVLAPPMRPRLISANGGLRLPFVYPLRLEDRLTRTYAVDRSQPRTIRWFHDGMLASIEGAPWFPFGTDLLGRDVFARLMLGARLSLGVASLAAAAALLIGALVGGIAGITGGLVDALLMKAADFVIALPAIYAILAFRASLPLVLPTSAIFWTMTTILAAVGWPIVARGVRAIVAGESRREYAEAARASGATGTRILLHHLLPATRGFLAAQATLLLPAFIVSEATLSFAGLGFDQAPSWGLMLRDAATGRLLSEAPWLLAPAGAIFITVLSVTLITAFEETRHHRLDFRDRRLQNR